MTLERIGGLLGIDTNLDVLRQERDRLAEQLPRLPLTDAQWKRITEVRDEIHSQPHPEQIRLRGEIGYLRWVVHSPDRVASSGPRYGRCAECSDARMIERTSDDGEKSAYPCPACNRPSYERYREGHLHCPPGCRRCEQILAGLEAGI